VEISVDGRMVRVATGGRTHDGDEPGVVFVHGAGADRTGWQLQTRWFAHHGYRAAAVDLPGHGGTDGPALETIAEMADWLAVTVKAMGLAPAHIVGHSMGSFVTLETAARHPEVARSIVLLGTAAAMPIHPELLATAVADDPKAARLITSWGIGSRAHRGGHASPGMWLIGGNHALIDRSPAGSLGSDLSASGAYERALDAAAEVSCPVTLILGREDKMTPNRAAIDLIDALADVDTVYFDEIGHFIHIEAPIATRQAVAGALAAAD
jgi:pimeloyl-ACP methyl ester carboxylesterase